jgi:hypothetical protein
MRSIGILAPLIDTDERPEINPVARLRHFEHHAQLVGPTVMAPCQVPRASGAQALALSLSLNLVKLFDRAPELALLTSPEDDHTEREDNQER